ncbi:MAG: glycosyltransferase [Lachnospiraceae bacterium]|nr:glycosyltransferase [Lachnospiraceae bacterium]
MQQKGLLSVIVPFYNAQDTIQNCLDSILKSCRGIPAEVICIDDGSVDDSRAIVEQQYVKGTKNVRLVSHQKNEGLFQARLTALRDVRGEYIGFVDSDDYVNLFFFVIYIV